MVGRCRRGMASVLFRLNFRALKAKSEEQGHASHSRESQQREHHTVQAAALRERTTGTVSRIG